MGSLAWLSVFSLGHCVARVLSNLRRSERQDDMVLGNPRRFKLEGDTGFGAVSLNPALSVDQVDMNQTAMNSSTVPPHTHQEIVITCSVEDRLAVDLAVCIRIARVLGQTHSTMVR